MLVVAILVFFATRRETTGWSKVQPEGTQVGGAKYSRKGRKRVELSTAGRDTRGWS